MINNFLPESKIDFCKEYEKNLNLTKATEKAKDFDPNKKRKSSNKKSKKSFSTRSQKSETFSVK